MVNGGEKCVGVLAALVLLALPRSGREWVQTTHDEPEESSSGRPDCSLAELELLCGNLSFRCHMVER